MTPPAPSSCYGGVPRRSGAVAGRGRDTIWLHYLGLVQERPLLGHGLGAGLLGRSYYDLPHNEYLRLLVEGGILGLVLYGGAVVLWGRQVLARVDVRERPFVRALFAALAVYALTDNVLTMAPGLVPFVYLALILGEPGTLGRATNDTPDLRNR